MKKAREGSAHRTGSITNIPVAVIASMLTFGIPACSTGTDDEAFLSAADVCDSSLDATAAAALKRLGGTDEYTELSGEKKFSLERSADSLYRDMTLRNNCVVFKAEDDSGHPLIKVTFSAQNSTPNRDSEKSTDSYYPMGTYAKTSPDGSALLYFRCPTQDPERREGSRSYIRSALTSPAGTSPSGNSHGVMTILNSVSRAMAKTLGCESEAALPEKVPSAHRTS